MIDNLGKYGFEINSHSPNSIKKVQGEIWELRPGSNRILYFYLEDNTYILLHGFVKRTQKTPKKEIEKALIEAKDCKRRNSK
ncbi:MAG: type II toxin-antitoxin system RelE/ParE family toxin [Bacteroidales bacterium]